MDKVWLARTYLGKSTTSKTRTTASIIYAIALTDSVDGMVTIDIDGTELTVPCVCSVIAGQRVIVSLVSGSPVVIGAVGWGDQIVEEITFGASAVGTSTNAFTIPCTSNGYTSEAWSGTVTFWAQSGSSKLPCVATISNLPTGMTYTTVQASSTEDGSITFSVPANTQLGGTSTYGHIVIDLYAADIEKTYTQTISWSKALAGADGTSGTNGTDGESATSVGTSTETLVIPCTSDGLAATTSSATVYFWAYKGSSQIACTATISGLPSGMSASITSGTASSNGRVVITVASGATLGGASQLSGIVNLYITADGTQYRRNISWAKALAGVDGEDGIDTASNYLYYDESYGLIICTNASSPHNGISTQITSTGLAIRSGTTILAQFDPNIIYLGKESNAAVIDLINGTGEIRQETEIDSAVSSTSSQTLLTISTANRLLLEAGDDDAYGTVKIFTTASSITTSSGSYGPYETEVARIGSRISASNSASGATLESYIACRAGGYGAASGISFSANDFSTSDGPVFAACTAIGTASTRSLSAGTITTVPLTGFSVRKGTNADAYYSSVYDDSRFIIRSNGVTCSSPGYVLVSGSVYINASSGEQIGCYVYVDGEEVTGTYFVTGGSTSVKSGAVVVPVSTGSVITLRARASSATTATPSDVNTYLSVVFV